MTTAKKDEQARKPVTKKEIQGAISKQHYAKATKLAKAYAFTDEKDRKSLLDHIQEKWDAKKAADKKKPAASSRPAKKKEASVETIEEKYNALIEELAAYETLRRQANKHANFFARHRRQLVTMLRQFDKFANR